mmetsp:Transcript_9288/g.21809  ORF Transcript_9288/g.21809 Transcript_9288/m.21809 type:complete len:229 (+) Transcript_9288:435-1121(+)
MIWGRRCSGKLAGPSRRLNAWRLMGRMASTEQMQLSSLRPYGLLAQALPASPRWPPKRPRGWALRMRTTCSWTERPSATAIVVTRTHSFKASSGVAFGGVHMLAFGRTSTKRSKRCYSPRSRPLSTSLFPARASESRNAWMLLRCSSARATWCTLLASTAPSRRSSSVVRDGPWKGANAMTHVNLREPCNSLGQCCDCATGGTSWSAPPPKSPGCPAPPAALRYRRRR